MNSFTKLVFAALVATSPLHAGEGSKIKIRAVRLIVSVSHPTDGLSVTNQEMFNKEIELTLTRQPARANQDGEVFEGTTSATKTIGGLEYQVVVKASQVVIDGIEGPYQIEVRGYLKSNRSQPDLQDNLYYSVKSPTDFDKLGSAGTDGKWTKIGKNRIDDITGKISIEVEHSAPVF